MQNLHHSSTGLLQNAAVTLLRNDPEFALVSRRLLADLVEHAGVVDLSRGALTVRPFMLVVVQGPVVVGAAAPADGSAAPAEVVLRRGVHWADEPALAGRAGRDVVLRAQAAPRTWVVHLDRASLLALLQASPALAAMQAFRKHFDAKELAAADTELVWMAISPEVHAPLVPLTELLVAAVGTQFGERVGMVTVDGAGTTLTRWSGRGWRPVTLAPGATLPAIVRTFRQAVGTSGPARLYFACAEPAASVTATAIGGASIRGMLHRVVYVTERELEAIPHGLEDLVHPTLHSRRRAPDWDGTMFSSFVPCRLVPPHPGRGTTVLASILRALPHCFANGFRTVPLDEWPNGAVGAAPLPRARHRLRKDQCRLAIDAGILRRDHDRWRQGAFGDRSFPAAVLGLDTADGPIDDERLRLKETAYRWARAVTNRRVGMALSGGGACAFRAVPLIEMLGHRGVPIDLFSGASGGSLLGAYYCTHGVAGLRLARERGWPFFAASLLASLWSGTLEVQVDRDLAAARVEDLEVILLPVTTALGDPPVASVVVGGTLGEAVRASGSALFSFGPTRKGPLRYVDGATATMIPAKVLSDHGADLVLAVNCVPGPLHGNPFGRYMIGRCIYRMPVVSRVIDTWVGGSYLLTTASRMAGVDAQVYWEPSPVTDPLFEAPHFECANRIVASSMERDEDAMTQVADHMRDLWARLGR
ncbi:MAG TPA: hypothetical protein VGK30_13270 [Candidatus Binatia bacterium]|jgi:predicted acylesterase/phospholipase RssA